MKFDLAGKRVVITGASSGLGEHFARVLSNAGKALVSRIPQRRLGELTELDGPLFLLISDAASHVTGAVIPVDGGHLVNSL